MSDLISPERPEARSIRREWDSNPRYPRGHNGFQDRLLKPLGHLSNAPSTIPAAHCLVNKSIGITTIMKGADHPLLVESTFTVKTYDIDFLGHVSNIVYIRWLEDLRLLWLSTYFPLDGQLQRGFAPILTRTNIQYRRAIKLFEPVVGRMWVESVGAARVYLGAQILVEGQTCADVIQEGVFAEVATGKPIRVPHDVRRVVDDWTGDAGS